MIMTVWFSIYLLSIKILSLLLLWLKSIFQSVLPSFVWFDAPVPITTHTFRKRWIEFNRQTAKKKLIDGNQIITWEISMWMEIQNQNRLNLTKFASLRKLSEIQIESQTDEPQKCNRVEGIQLSNAYLRNRHTHIMYWKVFYVHHNPHYIEQSSQSTNSSIDVLEIWHTINS